MKPEIRYGSSFQRALITPGNAHKVEELLLEWIANPARCSALRKSCEILELLAERVEGDRT